METDKVEAVKCLTKAERIAAEKGIHVGDVVKSVRYGVWSYSLVCDIQDDDSPLLLVKDFDEQGILHSRVGLRGLNLSSVIEVEGPYDKNKRYVVQDGEWVCGRLGIYFVPASKPEDLRVEERMLMEFIDMVDALEDKNILKKELLTNLAKTRAAQKGVREGNTVKDMHGQLWEVARIVSARPEEPELVCKSLDRNLETALCIKDVEVVK